MAMEYAVKLHAEQRLGCGYPVECSSETTDRDALRAPGRAMERALQLHAEQGLRSGSQPRQPRGAGLASGPRPALQGSIQQQ